MGEKIRKFEDLEVWKESMKLAGDIYQELKSVKDFGFRDQVQRAAVSIPSNIAEGFERQSNKEFIQFLFIARGSSGELRTRLYLAVNLKLLEEERCRQLIDQTRKVSAMLSRLIKIRKENF